jgi:L-ascorbate metabolism protein UlaG (beta-lactamase superfamily)
VGDRITYVGHATTLLELGGVRLLTDPLLRTRFVHIPRHAAPPEASVAEGVEAVLITHLHADHLDPPSLRRLGRDVRLVVPAGAAGTLRRRGFANLTELAPGDSTAIGPLEVTAIRAVHDARRYKLGRELPALGYLIESPAARVYFAGDTDLFDEMAELGDVDVALLPVAGWGARVGRGHLDPKRAAEAARRIGPRIVIPIHWGTFLSRRMLRSHPEMLTEPPRKLARLLAERAPGVELRLLEPGESLELAPPV